MDKLLKLEDLDKEENWHLLRTYRLDGHTPVKCTLMEQVNSRIIAGKTDSWRVSYDRISGDTEVSTVFLGSDHNFTRRGPPLLFESMVFNTTGEICGMDRCSTWEEAEGMHRQMVEITRAGGPFAWAARSNHRGQVR